MDCYRLIDVKTIQYNNTQPLDVSTRCLHRWPHPRNLGIIVGRSMKLDYIKRLSGAISSNLFGINYRKTKKYLEATFSAAHNM